MKRPDFTACYDTGRKIHLKHFVVFVRSRAPGEKDWRLGMAVTKKVGSAVVRNRIKRVLREFFRLHQALLPPAVDLVVVPKKTLCPETVSLDLVSAWLLPALREIGRAFGGEPKTCSVAPPFEEAPVRGGLTSALTAPPPGMAVRGTVGP